MVRWVLLVVGALLALIGAVWTGQGVGLITGSFMTGQPLWLIIGLVALLVGILLLVKNARRSPGTNPR
jgi:F0F1-type ATP synthase assembly protein I